MGTETFTAFKSDGTAYKLKGRILRHLDNDPVTDADKSNIRTTLGITSQGGLGDLLAANNLDDVASTSTAMENLKIPSIGSEPNQSPLNLHLGSMAYKDFDAFYETGTWNGVYAPSTGTFASITMDADLGYVKNGKLVTVSGQIKTDAVDTTGGSGQLKIDGLPFAASKVSAITIGFAWNFGSSFPLGGYISGSSIYLTTRTSTTARTDNFNVSGMTTGTSADRNNLYFSGTYQTA